MRFLGDMCVDVRIVKWLCENQHDATHLRDQGLHRMPNGEILDGKQCVSHHCEYIQRV